MRRAKKAQKFNFFGLQLLKKSQNTEKFRLFCTFFHSSSQFLRILISLLLVVSFLIQGFKTYIAAIQEISRLLSLGQRQASNDRFVLGFRGS
jgi:hypothetical protein